ncbi:MAG: T9SS type A sorting domain-containing protein [Flavobacteriales bacterium]|nr:T9SS type A sorting domain-containing protein [Flavobacteriales bacterium]
MKTSLLRNLNGRGIALLAASVIISGVSSAQTCPSPITGIVNTNSINAADIAACGGTLTINSGGSLYVTTNEDWTAAGTVSIVVNSGGVIDFDAPSQLDLAAGSSIILNGTGQIVQTGGPCTAAEKIRVGGAVIATCDGNGGALYSFSEINALGGIHFSHIWNGSVGTEWHIADNWTPAAVPGAGDVVAIPSSSGYLYPPFVFFNHSALELSIAGGGSVFIADYGSLMVYNSAVNDGSLAVSSFGNYANFGTQTGTGTYSTDKVFPTNNRFHYFSSSTSNPIASSTGVNLTPVNGSGQLVSEAGCNPLQLAAGSPWSQFLRMNENASSANNCSQELWFTVGAGEALVNGKGYAVMSGGVYPQSVGIFNNDDISVPASVISGTITDPLSGTISRGWYLLGNPYPCSYDIQAADLTSRGFSTQVQIWDGLLGSWIPAIAPVTIGKNQGFQVRKMTPSVPDAFTFYKFNKNAFAYSFFDFNFEHFLTVSLEKENFNMTTTIFFDENATDNFDPELEANRLSGDFDVPFIFTKAGENERMAYNAYAPLYNESKTVVMGVYDGATPGNFSLRFQDLATLENTTVTLEDTKLNTFTPVEEDFVYNFTTAAGDDQERFKVHFSMVDVSGIAGNVENAFTIFPNPAEDFVQISFTNTDQSYTLQVMDMSGKTFISQYIAEGTNQVQINTETLSAGMYLVELRSSKGERTVQKLIKK